MAGWGDLVGKIAQQFQGRVERLKNEREALLNERKKLIDGDCTARASNRIIIINTRLQQIETALSSKASD